MAALRRVALFLLCYFAILVLASTLKQIVPTAWAQLVWGAASSLLLLCTTALLVHRDGRGMRDVGANLGRGSAFRFAAGILIGLAVYCANFMLVRAFVGPIMLTPVSNVAFGTLSLAVASFLALSCMEELGFRGYALRTLHERFGLWTAQTIIAVAFALSHLAFGWPIQLVLLGVLPNALLFGMAAIASDGLAMPIAIHASVNVARWAFGETDAPGLLQMTSSDAVGTRIASVAPITGILTTLAAAAGLWWWCRRAGRFAS